MKKKSSKKNISAFMTKQFVLIFLIISLCSACALNKPAETNESEIQLKLLDKRMAAVEEKIDKLYSRLSIIQFMVDNHEQMIKVSNPLTHKSDNESTAVNNSDDDKKSTEDSLSPQKLYAKGIDYLKNKKYEKAVETFDEFLNKYPGESLADNALYWKGEAFYAQSKYQKSAEIFELVTTTYPDGTKCPDAMLKAGYSHLKLGDNNKAREFLQKVIKTYPFSNAAPKAQSKLKEIL